MFREIFVPLLGAGGDESALDAAMALAGAQQAHVTAMVAVPYPLPMVTPYATFVVETDQQQMQAARGWAKSEADRARARLAREAVSSEVRVTECFPYWAEESAALQALHCDLSILGRPEPEAPEGSPSFSRMFRSLLLRSGRPVLVVPRGAALAPPIQRVTLAWKPTPEASRALHEALPLFSRAAQIDVLVVQPRSTEGGYGEQPGADVAHLLARHGFEARVVELPRENLTTGDCILRHVRESGADLLVLGGYGHRHWRELVLGGTTRDVLAGARAPVFFSH
jgi:nucleotide-binding universal stress UspA family protein